MAKAICRAKPADVAPGKAPKIHAFLPDLCVIDRCANGRGRAKRGERRRRIDPTTCERNYNDDEIQFMKAMDQYKRDSRRAFPTWSEVLEVLYALGYRKIAELTQMPGRFPNRGHS
jgi:hypothetical protein